MAVTAGILYAACSALYAVVPEFTAAIYRALFHAGAVAGEAGNGISLGIFLLGLTAIVAASYIAGALFAAIYNISMRAQST
jgi:hypothetical protein